MGCTGTPCARCWPIRSRRVIADRIRQRGPSWSPSPASSTGSWRDDLRRPRKQRHTAKRIFERLRDEYGYDGGYTTVKDYVRENRRQAREMFVPLSHPPGHAQCDFGEALVVISGVERKAHCFIIDLPHSDGWLRQGLPGGDHRGLPGRARISVCPFWAECPRAFSTTIPGWRWRRYWATAGVNAPAPSPSCSLTTCSRTGSAALARAMTKARWRA